MPIAESATLASRDAAVRFFGRVVGERVSGFIDFDSAGNKRRLFFNEGRVFSGQSGIDGETLCDVLQRQGLIDAAKKQAALQEARDKKLPVEKALIQLGLPEATVLGGLERMSELLVRALLDEPATSYKLTARTDLRQRMLGREVELLPLLSRDDDDSLRDPNIVDRPNPAKAAAQAAIAEITAVHAGLKDKTLYEVLGVAESATPDAIRNAYFELAKRWHTDKYAQLELGPARDLLDALFAAVAEAHKTLSDPDKRKDYDSLQQRKRAGLPTDVGEIMKAEGLYKQGEGLLDRGQHAAALKVLSEAKTINPGEADFWALYGIALYLTDHNAKDAIAAAQQALKLKPNSPRAYECLGRVYRGEGDNGKAKANFDKCLDLDPKNIHAQRELRLMQRRTESAKHKPVEPTGFFGKLFKK